MFFTEWESEDAHTAHFKSDINQNPETGVRALFMKIADISGPMISTFVDWPSQEILESIMASKDGGKVVEMLRIYTEAATPRKGCEEVVAAIAGQNPKGLESHGAGWGFKDTGREGLQGLEVYLVMFAWTNLDNALEFRKTDGWKIVDAIKGLQRTERHLFKLESGSAKWDS